MGYSNVAGDLNVAGTTTLSTLTMNGHIAAKNITSTGTSNFANIIASNLIVTGNFTVAATNTTVSNSISIINQGTTTALYVNQNEFPNMTYNVAEFWDHTQLAMVIDGYGNVAIHQASSPGYALTVVQGALVDQLTLGTPLSISSGGTGTATGAPPNQVFAGPSIGSAGPPSFRQLVNADLPSYISVSNISANGAALSSLSASNVVLGTLSTSVFPTSGVTAGTYGSSANVAQVAVDTYGRVTAASNVAITSSQWTTGTGNIYYIANVGIGTSAVSSNLTVAGNIYASNALQTTNLVANTLTLSNATSTINVLGSVTATTYYGALAGSNTVNASTVTATTFYGAIAGSNLGAFSNLYSANALTTTNIFAAGFTSNATNTFFNFDTVTIPFLYSTTQNVYSTSNVLTQSIVGSTGQTSLYVSGNVYASNALTTTNIFGNTLTLSNATSTINVIGNVVASTFWGVHAGSNTGSFSNVLVASGLPASIVQGSNVAVFSNASGSSNVVVINSLGQVGIGTQGPTSTLQVSGNIYASNALTTTNIFTTNLTATGTISGTWNGTNQGTLLTLGTNLATGTSFATSTDSPTLQAYHVPLQSFTQNAIQTVGSYTITAQGLIKFNSTGLYQITLVLVMDSPVVKVALGTNSTSAFPSSTSSYTYIKNISAAASPSDAIVIPINVQNIANYYYIDVFCQSTTTSGTYYLTSGTTATGSQNGTYLQIAPFGTYISTAQNAASGILLTTTGGTYSSPLAQPSPLASPSNTYHITMTSGAGWSQSGTSSLVSVSPNGNLQFLQAGVFNVTVCYNATSPRMVMQIGIGSSASDSSLPSTIGPYIYKYAPTYTSDPSPTLVLPLTVTDTTKYYYLDLTVDTSTSVTLQTTSTFVSVTPMSSYIPTPMATASIVVSQVVTAQSTSYAATSSDSYIGMSNGGTVTIPLGASLTRGKMYTIKDESGKAGTNQAYNIIIQMSGADLIDGQSNVYVQSAWTSVNVMWTGANNRWVLV